MSQASGKTHWWAVGLCRDWLMGSFLVPVLSLTKWLAFPDFYSVLVNRVLYCRQTQGSIKGNGSHTSLSLGRPLRGGVSSLCLGAGLVG